MDDWDEWHRLSFIAGQKKSGLEYQRGLLELVIEKGFPEEYLAMQRAWIVECEKQLVTARLKYEERFGKVDWDA